MFHCIHTRSKVLMCTQFHLGISIKVYSVTLRLTQRHFSTLNRIQSSSIVFKCIQAHSKAFMCTELCSIAFNHFQYLLKGIHVHLSAFSGGHTHAKAFILVKQLKDQWIWLDVICQTINVIKIQYWEEEWDRWQLIRSVVLINDMTMHVYRKKSCFL